MSEFEELYDEEFFIIDSNELENVNNKFYGAIKVDGLTTWSIDELR